MAVTVHKPCRICLGVTEMLFMCLAQSYLKFIFSIHKHSCIVTKLCPPRFRRTLREFIRLHYPRRLMPVKLDGDKIKYVIREKENGNPQRHNSGEHEDQPTACYDVFGPSTGIPARCRRSVVEADLPPRQYLMRKSRWY